MSNKLVFIPKNDIYFVERNNTKTLPKTDICISTVGEKAYGLACLPQPWTLPYIVISNNLINDYRNSSNDEEFIKILNQTWLQHINKAIKEIIDTTTPLIIRSSSCEEGLNERGKLHSQPTTITTLADDLLPFLKLLDHDKDLNDLSIPLIIQEFISDEKEKGHLSNERRLYKDTRDWVVEVENSALEDSAFTINIRNWREKIDAEKYIDSPLMCNSRLQIKNTLTATASWAYSLQHCRIHFEWVYDGNKIYIVQADEAKSNNGINPLNVYDHLQAVPTSKIAPSILEEITTEHARIFPKIHNVFIYQTLKLPIGNLYILNNPEHIQKLKLNTPPATLEQDLENLFPSEFMIRMDVDSKDLKTRQMLPRVLIKDAKEAVAWLLEQSTKHIQSEEHNYAYIFHGFIPAISSAFAYAAPGERKVQIESLWGLPEGLYYNSHDKYVVDSGVVDIRKMDLKKFVIHSQIKYKGFCVVPNKNDEWQTEKIKEPYDWHGSIKKNAWINQIAHDSRLIADKENKPLSIMWFVDVKQPGSSTEILPWHHEEYDIQLLSKTHKKRKKTPFDPVFLIQCSSDIEKLRNEVNKEKSTVQFVSIQPSESDILRNKETLYEIGKITQQLNATILLEGGILSHAFYQLMQTGAPVEVLLPFNDTNETLVFNKLVRDKVPENIEKGGESAQMVKLSKESKLKALKEKLIEESFEVMDANKDEVLSELADVKEVLDQILLDLNISQKELAEKQKDKRNKAGGFSKGYVLIETQNLRPEHKAFPSEKIPLFDQNELDEDSIPEIHYELINNKQITRYEDKRKYGETIETILRVDSPILKKEWNVNSKEITLPSYPKEKLLLTISSLREGTNNRIELSITTEKQGQLDLFK